ncbi:hypothetical protein PSHT_15158 [Puccinia striiformis]|uniref:Uncharacterized protein n=1 Tax=Puccinia striiformis TaxID=27350 RepID=A0A2S4UGG8_9BASI|nr:hypothetical protein PSHT_15158 [Puccinia striiformis]
MFKSAASQSKKLKPNISTIASSHSGLSLELEDQKEHECFFTSTLQTTSLDNLSVPFTRLHRISDAAHPYSFTIKNKSRNQSSDLKKERRLIQAREAVNLAASSVLDLFVPLILDLSTPLLTPSKRWSMSIQRTIDYNALLKASEVIVHLFKNLPKDLASSSLPPSDVDDQSNDNSQRPKSI